MTQQASQMYEFGPFRVDPAERMLLRDGNAVPVSAKAFDTLLMLVQRSGHLVEKAELIHTIWPDSFVEEGNLKVVICALRKLLEDDIGGPKYIQTVAKHGYRFVGEVRSVAKSEVALPSPVLASVAPIEVPRRPAKLNVAVKTGVLALAVLGTVALLVRFEKPLSPAIGQAG